MSDAAIAVLGTLGGALLGALAQPAVLRMQFKHERQRVVEDHERNVAEDIRRHERAVCIEMLAIDLSYTTGVEKMRGLAVQVDDDVLHELALRAHGGDDWLPRFRARVGYVMRTPAGQREPDGHWPVV